MEVKNKYVINENTLALLPGKSTDYETIVLETDRKLKVKQSALALIDLALENDWTTYEGRRKAVMQHTNFRRKVPIPIFTYEKIYLFPTHSPENINNHWFSFIHIDTIKPIPNNTKQTFIIFQNGLELTIEVSYFSFQNQMMRTLECIYQLEKTMNLSNNKRFP